MPDTTPAAIAGDPSVWKEALDPEKMAGALEGAARRGRPSLPKNLEPLPATDPDLEAGLAAQDRLGRVVDAATREIVGRSLEVVEVVGQIQAFDYMHKMTGIGHLKLLADIKERKAYKGATLKNRQGELVQINTFDEFCEAINVSRAKLNLDLQNLRELGEEFMEAAQAMGLGYRQLRQLRALPEEDRALVIEGEKVGNDPEALKDLLEELVVKQARDKEALQSELQETRADLEASREVAADNGKKLTQAKEELARIKNIGPDERELLQAEKEREALEALQRERLLLRGSFVAYLARARAVLELEDAGRSAVKEVMDMTSSLCAGMADDLLLAGIDIDFRVMVYPMPCPQRGDGPDGGAHEEMGREADV